MSKVCEICGKAPAAGRSVSHSHRVTNRTFRPNIQKVTIKVN
ncbi:MAG: 50S ribosomal protein L28, partial [Anaerotardibacter sp.]